MWENSQLINCFTQMFIGCLEVVNSPEDCTEDRPKDGTIIQEVAVPKADPLVEKDYYWFDWCEEIEEEERLEKLRSDQDSQESQDDWEIVEDHDLTDSGPLVEVMMVQSDSDSSARVGNRSVGQD